MACSACQKNKQELLQKIAAEQKRVLEKEKFLALTPEQQQNLIEYQKKVLEEKTTRNIARINGNREAANREIFERQNKRNIV